MEVLGALGRGGSAGSGGAIVLLFQRFGDFGAGSEHREEMQSYFKVKFPPVVCFS